MREIFFVLLKLRFLLMLGFLLKLRILFQLSVFERIVLLLRDLFLPSVFERIVFFLLNLFEQVTLLLCHLLRDLSPLSVFERIVFPSMGPSLGPPATVLVASREKQPFKHAQLAPKIILNCLNRTSSFFTLDFFESEVTI